MNLSSLVKKWDNTRVKIGATERSKPAVLDWINCSDQLIKKKGIKLPIIPIAIIINKSFLDKLNLYPFIKKNE